MFAETEGIIPAPESAHAIASIVKEALRCKKSSTPKTLLFCLSGHGFFDMSFYDVARSGKLVDYEYPKSEIENSLKNLPEINISWVWNYFCINAADPVLFFRSM